MRMIEPNSSRQTEVRHQRCQPETCCRAGQQGPSTSAGRLGCGGCALLRVGAALLVSGAALRKVLLSRCMPTNGCRRRLGFGLRNGDDEADECREYGDEKRFMR